MVSEDMSQSPYKMSEVSQTPSDNEDYADYVKHFKFSWFRFFKFAGPGLLMSIAYLDPGNSKTTINLIIY